MSYPNEPDKHAGKAVITPEAAIAYLDGDPEAVPDSIVLCYHDGLFEHARERSVREIEGTFGECHALDGTDNEVGVVGEFGIGAPVTAITMESLVVRGAKRFVSVGHVGSLDPGVGIGDLVVCDRAVRDEGTSHHYVESERYAAASPPLVEALCAGLDTAGETYEQGATWTTDAVYWEAIEEVETYREEGVLTVDMEAAATFAIAAHRGVEAGALFTVSDYLDPPDWEPRFAETLPHLRRAFDLAVRALDRD
ncbi:phosphorylase [Halobacteriales archaeon QS_8_65_32]|nr:MAG: phosphorylase [Halobacteriales archaeon QS_8_65_32]